VQNAPLHVSRVSDDLQNFYPVLRSLQTALENITLDHSGLIEDIHLFLQKNLQTCIRIFRDITLLVHQYKDFDSDNTKKAVKYSDNSGKFTVGKWSSLKWDFQKQEINALLAHLESCKATCQLAVQTAQL